MTVVDDDGAPVAGGASPWQVKVLEPGFFARRTTA